MPKQVRAAGIAAALLAVIAVESAGIPAAGAQSAEDFYKDKRLKLIVGGSAGGGYDTYARAFSRYYVNYIPGRPSIIVQNMQGAGGIMATNFVASGAAPKDGSVFATSLRTVATAPLLDPRGGAKYDATKLNWLGSLANETSICVSWHTSPVKTFKDVLKQELVVGASNGNDTETFPAIFNNLLGAKFKVIVGYVAVGINLAMERGEVQGRCAWSWSSLMSQQPGWVKDKKINILAIASNRRSPDVPGDVPLVTEFAKSDEDRRLLDIFFMPQIMGRPYFLPDGVPADRVAAMRKAFDEAVKDPKLAADFERLKLELSPISGQEIQDMLAGVYASSPAMIERARDATKYRGEKVVAEIKTVKTSGTVLQSIREGRQIEFRLKDGSTGKAGVSGSKTKVTIAGKKAKRAEIKAGMSCDIEWPASGQQAKSLDCK